MCSPAVGWGAQQQCCVTNHVVITNNVVAAVVHPSGLLLAHAVLQYHDLSSLWCTENGAGQTFQACRYGFEVLSCVVQHMCSERNSQL